MCRRSSTITAAPAPRYRCRASSPGCHCWSPRGFSMSEGKAMLKHPLTGWLAGLALVCAALPAQAQTPAAADAAKNEGFPVQSDLVRAKCGSCHRSDDKGRMSRISYPPRDAGKLGAHDQAHGDAQPRDARAGRRARHPQVPGGSPGPRAGRGSSDRLRRRAPDDRVHLCGGQGRGRHLLVVSLDGARAQRAADEGGVGVCSSRCTAATTRWWTTSR